MSQATQKRIAKVRQIYDGRTVEAGEEFTLRVVPGEDMARHIELLLFLGRIEPKKGEPGYVAPAKSRRGAAAPSADLAAA